MLENQCTWWLPPVFADGETGMCALGCNPNLELGWHMELALAKECITLRVRKASKWMRTILLDSKNGTTILYNVFATLLD